MKSIIARFMLATLLLLTIEGVLTARPADKASPKDGDGSSSPSVGRGLEEWPTSNPQIPHQRIVWYQIVKYGSPDSLKLVSLTCADVDQDKDLETEIKKDDPRALKECEKIKAPDIRKAYTPFVPNDKRPLLSGDILVIAVFDPKGLLANSGVWFVTLAVSSQPATPNTPSLRPSAGLALKRPTGERKIYFLAWPIPLAGDTSITPTVTLYLHSGPTSLLEAAKAASQEAQQQGLPGENPPPSPGKEADKGAGGHAAEHAPKECACAEVIATAISKALTPAAAGKADDTKQISLAVPEPYPPVHKLYSFNITTGVVYSTLRNPTWSRVESAPPSGCTSASSSSCASPELYTTVENPAPRPIEPALFFTAYVFGSSDAPKKWHIFGPFDGERKWHWSDLIPQPSVGFSLTSPSTDFFAGGSTEVVRYVQIVYGVHRGKVNYLAPTITNDPTSSAAPTTLTRFQTGFFFGITCNVPFVKSAFGK